MNEADYISRLKTGDQAAFRELVETFRDQVFNTALGLMQNHEDAEDISQEVFVEIFRSVSSFRGDSKLSTWIYRITVQKSLEQIRNSRRNKRSGMIISLFGRENKMAVTASSPFYHPGVKLENKERAAILFEAIGRLPSNQRTAFILHKVEALSYLEISEILGLTISSVESIMFRAKQNLQKYLAAYYERNEK